MPRFFYASLLACCLLCHLEAAAQDRPIGFWRSHLPYSRPTTVATDGSTFFVGAGQAFFTYNPATGHTEAYSKAEGMHDVGVTHVACDPATHTTVIAYQNSNLDLLAGDNFYNLPDLKLHATTTSKTINDLFADNGLVYAATELGIVVINTDRQEIKETYVFNKNGGVLPVKSVVREGAYLYAAAAPGLYRASATAQNLQDFASWTPLDTTHTFFTLARTTGRVYAGQKDSVFLIENGALSFFYDPGDLQHLDGSDGALLISDLLGGTQGKVVRVAESGVLQDSFLTRQSRQAAMLDDGTVGIADGELGFGIHTSGSEIPRIIPPGPSTFNTVDILARNGDVWIAHGGVNLGYAPLFSTYGLSHRTAGGAWALYTPATLPVLRDSVFDFMALALDPADGTLYAGTYQTGLLELHPATGEARILKTGQGLDPSVGISDAVSAHGLAFDHNGNFWITQYRTARELAVRLKDDGSWHHFSVSAARTITYSVGSLIIDASNQKWYTAPSGGGVLVYDDNGTPANGADDRYRQLQQGEGNGGLPNNVAYCIAEDRDGAIWIGTQDGIGIVSCPAQVIDRQCEATRPIVQFDQFAGYLFQNESVTAIAVDGANRKWIGTANGLWLVSPSGDKVIYRYTTDNSPLPGNVVQKITIDAVTGDVYIGTDQGMVSFRSTATEGTADAVSEVLVFPNPVRTGYSGTIAIRGLGTDADVRITDVAGQLIYRTKALGGQAVWNGLDYTGHRPQSGVYLIFSATSGGAQRYVGKLIFEE